VSIGNISISAQTLKISLIRAKWLQTMLSSFACLAMGARLVISPAGLEIPMPNLILAQFCYRRIWPESQLCLAFTARACRDAG